MNRTTEIDAVNIVLSAVGVEPISTLVDLEGEEKLAHQILTETSRFVQSMGWNFNRDYDVTLSPGVDNRIQLSESIIQVDGQESELRDRDVVLRGSLLYDRKNRTYEFDKEFEVTTITLLDWDLLPEPARRYIAVRASRVFNQRVLGEKAYQSATLALRDEEAAKAELEHYEAESADRNLFLNTFSAGIISRRRQPNHLYP